ncbi:deoxyribose-phosphate aldolase [Lactiplantibacillus plajomi]|uniref:Deoxyribose-phosphate aldolase n=1 Tax=Lactiplantibacillus plajomi TaxID=1457217 RepID=A0ABV6K3A3_9LACO|nr:deoxyribose-phosphate aldolase [Lactiplantibacillus plajomi]
MKSRISKYIDNTLLDPTATETEITKLISESIENGFASVCVNPCWTKFCSDKLKQADVDVVTVIGFPLGSTTTAEKVYEASEAIEAGTDEIDMVMNIGFFKSGKLADVSHDIQSVSKVAHDNNCKLKVIIEAGLLSDEEIVTACNIVRDANADFVKTSTGFLAGGATVHAVKLMKQTVGDQLEVKAAGKIHNYTDAQKMVEAGATRLGASAGVQIVKEELSLINN